MKKIKNNNVILITASPRKKSKSTYAGSFFAKNLFKHYEFIDINKYNIKLCLGCDKCKRKLKCIIRDDTEKIIKKIEKADVIIVSSPIYFTGTPSPLKAFIDRNQVQWYKNKNKKIKNKTGIIILTADLKADKNFRAAESEIKSFFAVNKIKTAIIIKSTGEQIDKKIKYHIKRFKKNGCKFFR